MRQFQSVVRTDCEGVLYVKDFSLSMLCKRSARRLETAEESFSYLDNVLSISLSKTSDVDLHTNEW